MKCVACGGTGLVRPVASSATTINCPTCTGTRKMPREDMERRDLFAAAALVGLVSQGGAVTPPSTARLAYEIAGAMLVERAKSKP